MSVMFLDLLIKYPFFFVLSYAAKVKQFWAKCLIL